MATSRFHYLVDEYYRAWFFHHPEKAVDLGVEGYAGRLAPYGDDETSALCVLHEKLLSAIDELDLTALDEDQRIDVELMRGQALMERRYIHERDWRVLDPARYLPVNAIYQLTVRDVKDPANALRSRLAAIPEYLRGARSHLQISPERIPALWLAGAVEEAEQGARYFRDLTHYPRFTGWNLDALLEQAAQSLDDYAHFLSHDLANQANGSVACGRSLFDSWLHLRHGLDINADQLRAMGERLYAKVAVQLSAVTQELRGDTDIAALSQQIQQRFAIQTDLLGHYREQMLAARQFVTQHTLLTLPAIETLSIVTTPPFMRHRIPFAAYDDPMPTDPKQHGIYYVTPPADAHSMGEHNLLELRHTCVHEAWPGHHLQFVLANSQPRSRSVPRLVNTSATLYEGWALYSEQLMVEQGFLRDPESRFVLLKDRLWRALRILIDVDLHTRQVRPADCVQRLEQTLGFSHAQALGEIDWYSHAPTVPMGYATGWAMLNVARTQLMAQNQALSLQAFHDSLLGVGSIALPVVLRRAFGEPLWQAVRTDLFSA